MAKANQISQRDFRRGVNMKDQHHRPWHSVIEKSTGEPVSIQPLFTAPLMPPSKYLKTKEDSPYDLVIDYASWKNDLQEAHREYRRRMTEVGILLHGDKADASKPSPEQLLIVGQAPDPIEPILAAEKGNRWILGLAETMPDWAKPFFVKKVKDELEFPDAPLEPEEAEAEVLPFSMLGDDDVVATKRRK